MVLFLNLQGSKKTSKKEKKLLLSLTHTSSAARMQHGAFCSGRLIICESVCVCVYVSAGANIARPDVRERGGPDVAKSN
jgi:hypothetical protein